MNKWKKPKALLPTRLTKDDIIDISAIYKSYFINHPMPSGGHPELWFTVILDFLGWKGWDTVRPALQDLEDRIMKDELIDRYMEILEKKFETHPELTENEKIFLLITMGADLRKEIAVETLGILETR